MATSRNVVAVVVLQIVLFCIQITAKFPDFDTVRTRALNLGTTLNSDMTLAAGINSIKQEYEDNAVDVNYESVHGNTLVSELASELQGIMEKKTEALRESVKEAEKIARKYDWNGDLTIETVDYVASKGVNDSDPSYEFSDHFMQKVNFGNSSVHIPVEIYNGDIDILNGLTWTNDLDEVWKANREKDAGLLWQYFGSQSGIMRNYPASRWLENGVDLYDVRRRPWYTQGASSPKDMFILMDISGSTHGQALSLMKQSVKSLLETLGENDFVNVAYFSDKANWTGCFHTFVQANYRNKMRLEMFVDQLEAHGMASYSTALEFAFVAFEKFGERENNGTETGGIGANCNRIIMFLTDGGTEMPEEVFDKYNSDKEIRIFSYAVGPTANPLAAVRWMACFNRGFFYRIPAMGAIRSTVQHHVSIVSRPLTKARNHFYWSNIYSDKLSGLGMMTTVTLPVYNTTDKKGNQTLLGVMGCDVTVGEMEQHIPYLELGSNGYSFAVNGNGYIVFHPNLKAKNGWLQNPPNVDFLEVEYESEDKIELRKKMIDRESGIMTIETYVYQSNERYIDNSSRVYYYTPVSDTDFSVGIVLPEGSDLFWSSLKSEISHAQGLDYLQSDKSDVLLSIWDKYCSSIVMISENITGNDTASDQENLFNTLTNSYELCQNSWTQWLFNDAKVTKVMDDVWGTSSIEGIEASFVGTGSGLTRIHPAGFSFLMEDMANTWEEVYYTRSQDRKAEWLYSARYHNGAHLDENSTAPYIMVTKAVEMSNGFIPAVAGVHMNQTALRNTLLSEVTQCDKFICYLVDDGGFLMLSTEEDQSPNVGQFLADLEPELMARLVDKNIFVQNIQYDYQAACPVKKETYSAGPRSVTLPLMFEMLTMNWWMTKIAWMYVNFNIFEWLFAQPVHYAFAQEYTLTDTNYSCIKQLAQYTFADDIDISNRLVCGNCTRKFLTAAIKHTNLMLLMVEEDCGGTCPVQPLPQAPEETDDPAFPNDMTCTLTERYRRRPACFDNNPDEVTEECSNGAGGLVSSLTSLFTVILSLIVLSYT